MEDLLENLNDEQLEAVNINDGSLLVFAGAGSGKTRVITTKIAHAIKTGLFLPEQILAVTFTNKACQEMKDRVAKMTDAESAKQVTIKTFHSFGVWLLRMFPEAAGLKRDFQIYDDSDCRTMLQQCFPNEPKRKMSSMAAVIANLKDRMEAPPAIVRKYYNAYQKRLADTGHVDFADMILKPIDAIKNSSAVRDYLHDRFRMILVDEYQDSNKAQALLLRLLASKGAFVCVVGDDDQSIYRFRGADVGNILGFRNAFPDARTVVLGTNYRCSGSILAAARNVIGHNLARQQKNLMAYKNDGNRPRIIELSNDMAEADYVTAAVERLADYGNTAIIYRNNFQSKLFEDRLMRARIPYRIVGNTSFYDREEVKDALALLGLCLNHRDTVSFRRMVNKPSRGIGEKGLENLDSMAEGYSMDMVKTMEATLPGLKGKTAENLKQFRQMVLDHSDPGRFADNVAYMNSLLGESGVLDMYAAQDEMESTDRCGNLSQLVGSLSDPRFLHGKDGIQAFLDDVALTRNVMKESGEGVTLITMHSTKGLEFRHVFVVGAEDEILPGISENNTDPMEVEEERRLFYVAMTRAMDDLCITSAASRMMWGSIRRHHRSRFVNEIQDASDRRF